MSWDAICLCWQLAIQEGMWFAGPEAPNVGNICLDEKWLRFHTGEMAAAAMIP